MTKVLVIDDDEMTTMILREMLESRSYNVVVAHNGDSGVAIARSDQPDLILLDLNMPKMTGMEVLPILRSHPSSKKTPIIALTGYTSSASRDEAHLAGCDRYVTKPIDKEKLFKAIDGLLS